MISRGTVGGRPAGERLFRARLPLSPADRRDPPSSSRLPSRVRDANNEVIPRDAAAVSVETPRRRALSHPGVTSRRPIPTRAGCRSRDAKGGVARDVGMKARRREAGVEKLSEVTCVRRQKPPSLLHDVVGPVLPRRRSARLGSRFLSRGG